MSAATPAEAGRLLRILGALNDAGCRARIVNCRVFTAATPEAEAVVRRLLRRGMAIEVEQPAANQPYIIRLLPVPTRQRRKRNDPTK